MDRYVNDDWLLALLTVGAFLATLVIWVFAYVDALDGSPWYLEFELGLACALAFVSLLSPLE
jgi:hypothetical protein